MQVIEAKRRDELNIKSCRIRLSKYVHPCGLFTNIVYGPHEEIEKNTPIIVSEKDCRNIHVKGEYTFKDGLTIKHFNFSTEVGYFSADWVTRGKRYAETDSCSGASVSVNGKFFDRHVLRYILTIELGKLK